MIQCVFRELRPHRAIYVSCNPEAFASELPAMLDAGYTLDRVQPVDMFPHTDHVELVATLNRLEGSQVAQSLRTRTAPAVPDADQQESEDGSRTRRPGRESNQQEPKTAFAMTPRTNPRPPAPARRAFFASGLRRYSNASAPTAGPSMTPGRPKNEPRQRADAGAEDAPRRRAGAARAKERGDVVGDQRHQHQPEHHEQHQRADAREVVGPRDDRGCPGR